MTTREKYEKAKHAARVWNEQYVQKCSELAHLETIVKDFAQKEDKLLEKISRLEREKLLCDGRIQQLEEARKDIQERYNELKQDFRELMRGQKP